MDIDGDGVRDILSGSYSRMEKDMAGLFQVLRGKKGGGFAKAEELKGTDGEPLIIPADNEAKLTEKICTRPFAVDWDGDGQLDIVTGNFAGSFYWFKGEGKGKFQPKPQPILVGKEPLKIKGVHSDPFVVDWDKDGDLDILTGSSSGGVTWAENTAGKGKMPELKPLVDLIQAPKEMPYGQPLPIKEDELTGPTTATRVWVEDVNEDGKLDLLVGDSVTLTAPAKGLTVEEFKKKQAEWQQKVDQLSKLLASPKADQKERQKANEDFSELYQKRSEFIQEDRTGYVWVYLQK